MSLVVSASFPGVLQFVSLRTTITTGIDPSVAIVKINPQLYAPSVNGSLVYSDGVRIVQWTNAHIDFATLKKNQAGQYVTLLIQDRRVWWKFTEITGMYNERAADGSILTRTEKTVPELAALLLDAMGESGYDISQLPDNSGDRPLIDWSCSNPAVELFQLCDERGCDIVFQHTYNRVVIVQRGIGSLIPNSGVESVAYAVDVAEYPATLKVCCNLTRWQAKFKLRAVGVDTDGEIKPIDDLSYTPADGWELEFPGDLIPDGDPDERQLANETVFRLYEIEAFADGSLDLPDGSDTLDHIDQVFPVGKYLVEAYESEEMGADRTYPKNAYVEGVFGFTSEKIESIQNSEANTRYPFGFHLIPDQGLVLFSFPVIKYATDEFSPADLYLVTSFSVRDNDSYQYTRHTRTATLVGGTGTLPISRPDLVRTIVANYTDVAPTTVDSVTDNQTAVNTKADAILVEAASGYASVQGLNVIYTGILDILCDGVTKQVSHQFATDGPGKGARTTVAQNVETEVGIPKLSERRDKVRKRRIEQENDPQATREERWKEKRGTEE